MKRSVAGFALVLTLVLLGLLVLALLGLGASTRLGHANAAGAAFQGRARQHALLGLSLGLGELQRLAGPDDRVTGMAGIAGVTAGAAASTRYWTGVWTTGGDFLGWLTSGAASATTIQGELIELYAANSVGLATSTSANVEKQHVLAGKVPVPAPRLENPGALGGAYAYVVLDEGIKVSAYAPTAERAVTAMAPQIGDSMLVNQLKLRTAVQAQATVLPNVLVYEQLGLLSGVTPSVLQDCFHYVALTPRTLQNGRLVAGQINVNTASALVWRCLLDAYNTTPLAKPIANVAARGNRIANGFAASTAGKDANGPFGSLPGLTSYLETIFPATGSPTAAEIVAALGPMLVTRSDTFRIRAYGEATNPGDGKIVEAVALCEAMVQRTPTVLPGFGRRFVITSFRWLGPDDQ